MADSWVVGTVVTEEMAQQHNAMVALAGDIVKATGTVLANDRKVGATFDDGRPWDELRSSGLLWLINRVVFHPRGFALCLVVRGGEIVGWKLQGNGREVWAFPADGEDDFFSRAEATLAAGRSHLRQKSSPSAKPTATLSRRQPIPVLAGREVATPTDDDDEPTEWCVQWIGLRNDGVVEDEMGRHGFAYESDAREFYTAEVARAVDAYWRLELRSRPVPTWTVVESSGYAP